MGKDTVESLEDTDRAVLTVFHYEERPLWKERVHECLQEYQEVLPITEGISVKTVNLRVDVLHKDEYLEAVIASPDPTVQELITAYILAEKGEDLFDI